MDGTSFGFEGTPLPSRLSGLFAVCVCLVPPLTGVLIAYVMLVRMVIPAIGVGSAPIQRIVDLGNQLSEGFDQPVAAVIGNSVVVEGVSAEAVQGSAPEGWGVRNFAVNGCDVTEQQIILPRLIEARPSVVVFVHRPIDVGTVEDVNVSKLNAYNLADFDEAMSTAYLDERLHALSSPSRAALLSEEWRSKVYFRRSPLTTAESIGLRILRKGEATLDSSDWNEPYELNRSISGDRLDRHFRVVIENGIERTPQGVHDGADLIAAAVKDLSDSGILSVLVIAPAHPEIPEKHEAAAIELRELYGRLADEQGSIIGDASSLLEAEDFADAIHPNASGRQKLSDFIGRLLPDPSELPRGHSGAAG